MPVSPLKVLFPPTLASFRNSYFSPSLPCLFPSLHFASSLPAISEWFIRRPDKAHLQCMSIPFFASLLGDRANKLVCIEVTSHDKSTFHHALVPFSLFLHQISTSPSTSKPAPSLYLAQCPLSELPELADSLPTPDYVSHADKGDIYAINLWLGRAGAVNTPLHRDPNPNLFVQLAGRKRVRMFAPEVGQRMMTEFGGGARRLRTPDEMMVGERKDLLEKVVWGMERREEGGGGDVVNGFEAEVGAGDGIFIPKGWWHAIRGVGSDGVTASVRQSPPQFWRAVKTTCLGETALTIEIGELVVSLTNAISASMW